MVSACSVAVPWLVKKNCAARVAPPVVVPCTVTPTFVPMAPVSCSVSAPLAGSTEALTESEPPVTKAVTDTTPMPVGSRVVSSRGEREALVYRPPCDVAVKVSAAVTNSPRACVKRSRRCTPMDWRASGFCGSPCDVICTGRSPIDDIVSALSPMTKLTPSASVGSEKDGVSEVPLAALSVPSVTPTVPEGVVMEGCAPPVVTTCAPPPSQNGHGSAPCRVKMGAR